MTSLWPADLALPTLIEEIDFESILAAKKERAVERFAANGLTYDTLGLESDPGTILLEHAAFEEMLVRQRINEAVRGQFLPFSSGKDIDYLGGFYKLPRMVGESDKRYADRIVLKISAGELGGSEPHYRLVAMSADLRVADAKPYRIGRDPTIYIAIISTDNDGVADATLLAKVDAALQDVSRRLTNDTIIVSSAARQTLNIIAKVWLLPEAPSSLIAEMKAALQAAWPEVMKLGRDVNEMWLKSKLYQDGVHNIEIVSPSADQSVPFNEIAALGTVTLELMGRAY